MNLANKITMSRIILSIVIMILLLFPFEGLGLELPSYIIHKNIYLTKGVVFSQRILTRLVEKGLSSEESYDLVQSLALKTLNGEFESFRNALESNEIIIENLKSFDLDERFDEKFYLRNIDFIYKRVGLI